MCDIFASASILSYREGLGHGLLRACWTRVVYGMVLHQVLMGTLVVLTTCDMFKLLLCQKHMSLLFARIPFLLIRRHLLSDSFAALSKALNCLACCCGSAGQLQVKVGWTGVHSMLG